LEWADEFTYSPVKQTLSTAIDGSLIVEVGLALAGRPITLSAASDVGWVPRSLLVSLLGKQNQPGLQMTLTHNGVAHNVIFAQPGIDAKSITGRGDPTPETWYSVTLKFIKVA
jgi:hypothetical protein